MFFSGYVTFCRVHRVMLSFFALFITLSHVISQLRNTALKKKDHDSKAEFKSFKKLVERKVRQARTDYLNNQVFGGLEDGNTKPFYRYIKSLKSESTGLASLKEGSDLVTSPQQKAEILLDEFSSVFTSEDKDSIPWLGTADTKIDKLTVTRNGVEKLLEELKPHKAAGPDRISNKVLKELSKELAPVLTDLFNQSLNEGTIPKDWSSALITPVFKKGNVHKASNYRPVSLTCVICKLLEHIICSHVTSHLVKNELLTHLQHGFRKGHSCESQLIITTSDFYDTFNAKEQTDVGILDFSRAFDTVPHERLMGKLAHYGVQGQINNWIRAFLTDRKMEVVVDGECSKSAPVTSGVPQGTVLGPLLFLLYINDIPNVISPGTYIRLFADDCLVYRVIKSPEDQRILQNDLDSLQAWTEKWGMKFNPGKCQVMHIARNKPLTHYYQLCGEFLCTVDSAKYLGIIISNDLNWHEQVCSVAKKANSVLHLIARNLTNAPRATKALAYITLVRPRLEYCATVWDPSTQKDSDILEKVNRRAARIVYRKSFWDKEVSPTKLLNDLGWKTLAHRRQNQRLTMLYKISYGLVAIPPTRLLQPARSLRGHTSKYQTLRPSCDTVKNSFYYRTIPTWNKLSQAIVSSSTVESFKAGLSKA